MGADYGLYHYCMSSHKSRRNLRKQRPGDGFWKYQNSMCGICGCRVARDPLFPCELNKSQLKSKICFFLWALKTLAQKHFFTLCNFPQGQASRQPPFLNLLHISGESTGAGRKWPLGHWFSPDTVSLFSLKFHLWQKKRNFDLKEKSFVVKTRLLLVFLFSSLRRNSFFFYDKTECNHSFEYFSEYITQSLVRLKKGQV